MTEKKSSLPQDELDYLSQCKFYRHDNAIFRQRPGGPASRMGIDDVLHGNQFVPYKGDRVEPIFYGNQITFEDVLAEMKR